MPSVSLFGRRTWPVGCWGGYRPVVPRDHMTVHALIRDLGERAALTGDQADVEAYRVALRVHLEEEHQLPGTRDPVGDHERAHGAEA